MQICPGCNHEIPPDVVTCPHCRYWLRGVLEKPETNEEKSAHSSADEPIPMDNSNSSDGEEELWGELKSESTAARVLGILRSAFVIWRHLLSFLILLAAIAQFSSIPIRLLYGKANIQPTDFEKYTLTLVFALILAAILGAPLIFGSWAAALKTFDDTVAGSKVRTSAFSSFLKSFQHFWVMLGSYILVGAAMVVAILPAILASYWAKNGGSESLAAVLSVAGFIGLVILNIKWSVVAPVVVLEGYAPKAALQRSAGLVRGMFGTILGVKMMYWIFVLFIQSVASLFRVNPILGEIALTGANIVFATPLAWAIDYGIFKALTASQARDR